jgi:uncharacterized protein YkwD
VTRLARALLLLAAVPAFALTATPAATAAPAPAQVEAEAVSARGTAVRADAAASGRRAIVLAPGRSITVRVSAPATGSRLVLRLRTAAGRTTHAPAVVVDGRRAAAVPVPGRTWRDQVVGAGHSAGTHTVTITNRPGRRRLALLVDRVAFVPGSGRVVAPATAKAPAPATATAKPPAPAAAAAPVDDAYEARIVALVNAERAAAGLPRLAVSTCADRFAEDWSATMARTSVFEHRPSLGTVLTGCRASAVGENIAYGSVSADRMMAMWMGSAGHRANILSSRFTHIGVGAAPTADGRTYGTQNFLRLT